MATCFVTLWSRSMWALAMIAVAVLVGVWPATTSLAPSCSRMKSNDLLDSSRGGLNSQTLAPRSPKSCKLSTSSLMAIYSFACSGGWQSWTAPTEVVLQTNHKTVANKCPVHHVHTREVIVLSWGNTEVTRRRVVGWTARNDQLSVRVIDVKTTRQMNDFKISPRLDTRITPPGNNN